MALKEPYMIKTGIGLGADTTLELEADTGEAFMVKDVYVGGSDDNYVELLIDKVSVGFFRVGKSLGNHLPFPFGFTKHSHDLELSGASRADAAIAYEANIIPVGGATLTPEIVAIDDPTGTYNRFAKYAQVTPLKTLLNLMAAKGWFTGYPVAEGQKFTLKPYTSGKKLNDAVIIYEKWDPGDIKKDAPNGSESKEYVFVGYGDAGSALTTADDYKLDTANNPDIYTGFPFTEDVPAKTKIDILGICGSESCDYDSATDYSQTKYLKLVKERTTLFDEDRNGLLFYQPIPSNPVAAVMFAEGRSMVGNYSEYDRREPFIAPTPLTFNSGEELNAYITVGVGSAGAGSISQEYGEVAMIMKVTKVS